MRLLNQEVSYFRCDTLIENHKIEGKVEVILLR